MKADSLRVTVTVQTNISGFSRQNKGHYKLSTQISKCTETRAGREGVAEAKEAEKVVAEWDACGAGRRVGTTRTWTQPCGLSASAEGSGADPGEVQQTHFFKYSLCFRTALDL